MSACRAAMGDGIGLQPRDVQVESAEEERKGLQQYGRLKVRKLTGCGSQVGKKKDAKQRPAPMKLRCRMAACRTTVLQVTGYEDPEKIQSGLGSI